MTGISSSGVSHFASYADFLEDVTVNVINDIVFLELNMLILLFVCFRDGNKMIDLQW